MQILLRFKTRVLILFTMFLVPAMDIGIKVFDDQMNNFCFELVAQEMFSGSRNGYLQNQPCLICSSM